MSDDTAGPPRDPTPAMLTAAENFIGQYVPAGTVPEFGIVELWQAMWDAATAPTPPADNA